MLEETASRKDGVRQPPRCTHHEFQCSRRAQSHTLCTRHTVFYHALARDRSSSGHTAIFPSCTMFGCEVSHSKHTGSGHGRHSVISTLMTYRSPACTSHTCHSSHSTLLGLTPPMWTSLASAEQREAAGATLTAFSTPSCSASSHSS